MIHLDPGQRLFISKDLMGYADKLDKEGVFPRRLDLLLYGFSYAVTNELPPDEDTSRQELLRAMYLNEAELPISAVAQWYADKLDHPLENNSDLLDFIGRVGIAGVRELKKKWEGRNKAQIQWDVLHAQS